MYQTVVTHSPLGPHHLSPKSPRLMFLFVKCSTVNQVYPILSFLRVFSGQCQLHICLFVNPSVCPPLNVNITTLHTMLFHALDPYFDHPLAYHEHDTDRSWPDYNNIYIYRGTSNYMPYCGDWLAGQKLASFLSKNKSNFGSNKSLLLSKLITQSRRFLWLLVTGV